MGVSPLCKTYEVQLHISMQYYLLSHILIFHRILFPSLNFFPSLRIGTLIILLVHAQEAWSSPQSSLVIPKLWVYHPCQQLLPAAASMSDSVTESNSLSDCLVPPNRSLSAGGCCQLFDSGTPSKYLLPETSVPLKYSQ